MHDESTGKRCASCKVVKEGDMIEKAVLVLGVLLFFVGLLVLEAVGLAVLDALGVISLPVHWPF